MESTLFLFTYCVFKLFVYISSVPTMGHQKTTKMTTTIKTSKICKGIYQTEWNGHIVQISNESEFVEGTLIWAIISDTLDVRCNEGQWDTLYSTKKEALERLPEILETSKPY